MTCAKLETTTKEGKTMALKEVSTPEFLDCMETALAGNRYRDSVDIPSGSDLVGSMLLVNDSETDGLALRYDGYVHALFSAGHGAAGELLEYVTHAYNGLWLDAFNDKTHGLVKLYNRYGFAVVATVELNRDYNPPATATGVVVMVQDGKDAPVKTFDKNGYDGALLYGSRVAEVSYARSLAARY